VSQQGVPTHRQPDIQAPAVARRISDHRNQPGCKAPVYSSRLFIRNSSMTLGDSRLRQSGSKGRVWR
jgi:hypothetical protein